MLFIACGKKQTESVVAPWGDVIEEADVSEEFDLTQIQHHGEMIMLTVTGPDSYYDYHGRALGTHYMLCQRLAEHLGVSLRVEVCRDTADIHRKIMNGDGDIAIEADTVGVKWIVSDEKPLLNDTIRKWYQPSMLAEVKKEEDFLLSTKSVTRRVFAPMLNSKSGVISHYDAYFKSYSQTIRWDWRLMAAQCYQESTFDPHARSWAGACGLMQIMPSTAEHLGLPASKLFEPESNIAAAAKYIRELDVLLNDIRERSERIDFVLACYNGGYHHIRDAMKLTEKYGGNPHRWSDVSRYVLLLTQAKYYNDPVVKYGYMRGSETVDYVRKINQRWMGYRGVKSSHAGFSGMSPRKATHQRKKKYQI